MALNELFGGTLVLLYAFHWVTETEAHVNFYDDDELGKH